MGTEAIAVIGLGAMGSGMAGALLDAGFPVIAYNRTAAKAEPISQAGGRVAATAADAVGDAEVVLLSLADESAVAQVLFGDLTGRWREGMTVVDTSTVAPRFARETTERLSAIGVRRVEATVLGNPQMAAAGSLRVFAAGDASDVDSVSAVLDAIGQEVRYIGAAGSACALKLALNLMLGVQTVGLAEAVGFAEGLGVGRETLLDVFDNSGWRSPVLAFRAGFVRRRTYRPAGFRSALMHKDLDLALVEARANGLDLALVERAAARFGAVVDAGYGDDDAAVVAELT